MRAPYLGCHTRIRVLGIDPTRPKARLAVLGLRHIGIHPRRVWLWPVCIPVRPTRRTPRQYRVHSGVAMTHQYDRYDDRNDTETMRTAPRRQRTTNTPCTRTHLGLLAVAIDTNEAHRRRIRKPKQMGAQSHVKRPRPHTPDVPYLERVRPLAMVEVVSCQRRLITLDPKRVIRRQHGLPRGVNPCVAQRTNEVTRT